MSNNHSQFKPKDNALQDRIILVTGAGDGIGRAAAKGFASLGATVILLGKTLEKLESVYDDIEGSQHPLPMLVPFDLESTDEQAYEKVADAIQSQFGHLDGLLHSAGILGDLTLIEHYKPSVWMRVMQTNVNAPFLLTRSLLPLLKQSPYGASIIMTSSSVGRQGRAHWGAYAASKFATEGLMQTLADELANTSTTRVNSINPGATRTKMRALAYPAEDPRKLLQPEEILGTYYYLMCDDSKGVTGQALNAQSPK